ncbi:hypothetical protein TSMEX_003369 [Taenia solium]|eukprot:TsM_000528800 transcript=TsM_000528800 gene=TsM_000528800
MSSWDVIKSKKSTNILLSDIKKEPEYSQAPSNVSQPEAPSSPSCQASHVPHASAPASASSSVVVSTRDSQFSTTTNLTTTNLVASLFGSPSNLIQQLRTKSMSEMSSTLRVSVPFSLIFSIVQSRFSNFCIFQV